MTRIRRIRRLAGVLAGLAGALLAVAAAAPNALASPLRPDPPWWLKHWSRPVHPRWSSSSARWSTSPLPLGHGAGPVPVYQVPAHTTGTSGLPGWQIALIAAAAALAVATVLVLLDRAGRASDDGHGGRAGEVPAQGTQAISRPAGQKPLTQRSR
jgi:hypothetical protein